MLEQHTIFKVIRTSKYYFYFSLLQLILTMLLLILVTFFPKSDTRFGLEILITILLLADLLLKKLTDTQFLKKCKNIVDLGILTTLIFFVIMEICSSKEFIFASEIGYLIIIVRYGIQLYRIYSLVNQSKEVGLLNRLQQIRFDDIEISQQININRYQRKQPKAN